MSWSTPKTDWDTDDGIGMADLNLIGENTVTLHKGNGQAALASITAANNLDINETDETFLVTGNTQINYIKTLGRQLGNKIILIFMGTPAVYTGQNSPPADYANITINKSIWLDQSLSNSNLAYIKAGTAIFMVYTGTTWQLIS